MDVCPCVHVYGCMYIVLTKYSLPTPTPHAQGQGLK